MKEQTSAKSINEEIGFLLRLLQDQGSWLTSIVISLPAIRIKCPTAYSAEICRAVAELVIFDVIRSSASVFEPEIAWSIGAE